MKKVLPALLSLLCLLLCVNVYAQAPVISSFSPTSGAVDSTVIITGSNFNTTAANNVVHFGAALATVTAATATQLTVTVPAGTTSQPVWVLNKTTGLQAAARNAFGNTFDPAENKNYSRDQFLPVFNTASDANGSVTLADIDGDGKTDVLYINSHLNVLSVLRNTGSAGGFTSSSFAAKVSFGILNDPAGSITVGDVDGDGKPDLITIDQDNRHISVLRNTSVAGTISFAARIDISTKGRPQSAAIGDLDNDGKPEIVVCDSVISVYKNTSSPGNFSLAAAVNFNAARTSAQLHLTDVDGDGKPDVIVTSNGAAGVAPLSIYQNQSSTGVIDQNTLAATPVNFNISTGCYEYAIADFNGDGKPDIFVPGGLNNVLFINTATPGTISSSSFSATSKPNSSYINAIGKAADVNGDGKPDVVVLKNDSLYIQFNLAATGQPVTINSFGNPVAIPVPIFPDIFAVGDLDGDGRPDLISSVNGQAPLQIFRSRSLPRPAITSFTPASGAIGTTVTINGQGFNSALANNIVYFGATQAVVTSATTTQLKVIVPVGASYQPISILNTEQNLSAYSAAPFNVTFAATALTLAPKVDFATGKQPSAVVSGDLDGDGIPDLLVANKQDNTISVYRNTSTRGIITTASFTAKMDRGTSAGPTAIQLADIDGDGKLDIIITAAGLNRVCVFRNTSLWGGDQRITFAPKILLTTKVDPQAIAIADFDGDGKADIAVADSDNRISVLRNLSSSGNITVDNFDDQLLFNTGASPKSIAAVDFNADSKTDLVVTNSGSNIISVLYNNTPAGGTISFAKVDFATGTNPQGVAVGDLNADGKPDIAVANKGDNTVSIFRNTSTGGAPTFAAKVDFVTGTQPVGVTIADINGNNKPEVIVSNSGAASVAVMLNRSAGTTIDMLRYTVGTGVSPTGITTGDMDADGRPDVVVVNTGSNTLSVLRNSSPPQSPPAISQAPVIASFSPAFTAIGSSVTITGTNFNTNPDKNMVYFGTSPAVVTSVSATSLTVTVPAGSHYEPITVINDDTYLKGKSYLYFTTSFTSKHNVTAADFDPKIDLVRVIDIRQDLDGDGKHDSFGNNRIYKNVAVAGQHLKNTSFNAGVSISSVPFDDINNDGLIDLAKVTPQGTINTLSFQINATRPDSDYLFNTPVNSTATLARYYNTPGSISKGDIDGDGKIDLIVPVPDPANPSSYQLRVYLNNSDGRHISDSSFVAGPIINAGGVLEDVDGDGKPDLVSLHGEGISDDIDPTDLWVCRNTSTLGRPSFATPVVTKTSINNRSIILGDLDGDGKKDVIAFDNDRDGFVVFRNSYTLGQGPWNPYPTAALLYGTGASFYSIALGDIDGDGKVDLVANAEDGTSAFTGVYRFIGSPGSITEASYATPARLAGPGYGPTVFVDDIDGDGRADIYSGSVFRNNPIMPPGFLAVKKDTVLASKKVALQSNTDNSIVVHQGISPNGDGLNDVLTIDNIDKYADNKVTIINTNGDKIFEKRGYNNSSVAFDGHSATGVKQQPGTYYYVLEYMEKGEKQMKTGYVVLKY